MAHGGGGHHDEPKRSRNLIVWLIVAAFAVLGVFLFNMAPKDSKQLPSSQTTPLTNKEHQTVTPAAAESPTVSNRSVQGGVSCPSMSPEKQKCSFDETPTEGFGSKVAGMHFCYDKPYGPSETYSRDRWDASQRKWVEWTRNEEPGVVYQQRLRSNIPGSAVTVTYWLSNSEACTK